jgi:hypothetical protein
MEEAGQAGSVPMSGGSTLQQKQHSKLRLSIVIHAEGKYPCKPYYLGNITGFLNLLMLPEGHMYSRPGLHSILLGMT